MIRFACPSCQTAFNVDPSKAGLRTKCPKCGQRVAVPQPRDVTLPGILLTGSPPADDTPTGGQTAPIPEWVQEQLQPKGKLAASPVVRNDVPAEAATPIPRLSEAPWEANDSSRPEVGEQATEQPKLVREFRCSSCKAQVTLKTPAVEGKTIKCPKCGKLVSVKEDRSAGPREEQAREYDLADEEPKTSPGRPRRLLVAAVIGVWIAVAASLILAVFLPKRATPPQQAQSTDPGIASPELDVFDERLAKFMGKDEAAGGRDTAGSSGTATGSNAVVLQPDVLFSQASSAVLRVMIQNRQGQTISFGSGFLVGNKRLVVTNYHVIEKAHTAHVVLADKTVLYVEGAAALDQGADIAIIKLSDQMKVQPLELAGSNLPPVGTKVYAIGNPKGLDNTLSDGLVSGHRDIDGIPMIQTNAAISPGSSGGPLFGPDGKVVGVTTSKRRGGENLNFAVPASHAAKLLRRCEGETQLTQFPLVQQPITEVANPPADRPPDAKMAKPEEWSQEDVENAAHFVRAFRASDAAFEICRKAGHPPGSSRPWMMAVNDRREFARLITTANQEATLVRKDVLKRMNASLPVAFEDYITATSYMGAIALSGRPDNRATAIWSRFGLWWGVNKANVRVPPGAVP
ncbi:hypothetical protein AYO44_13170 [Planctomycetaceae bacterium SCGC AG-212-F19]|nr:hypothetical protein AYO44_13170 [Planctomycetaceae bacterium SCGC AG-212-F19]